MSLDDDAWPAGPSEAAIALVVLMGIRGVGRKGALRLIARTPEPLTPSTLAEIAQARDLDASPERIRDLWEAAADRWQADAEQGVCAIAYPDAHFPARLRRMPDPPAVLYVKGARGGLAAPHALAVVGTREPTDYGARVARRSAARAVEAGFVIVRSRGAAATSFAGTTPRPAAVRQAYVNARYSKHYKVTGEELEWIAERVQLLDEAVRRMSVERLGRDVTV